MGFEGSTGPPVLTETSVEPLDWISGLLVELGRFARRPKTRPPQNRFSHSRFQSRVTTGTSKSRGVLDFAAVLSLGHGPSRGICRIEPAIGVRIPKQHNVPPTQRDWLLVPHSCLPGRQVLGK